VGGVGRDAKRIAKLIAAAPARDEFPVLTPSEVA
jgi:hypothetical protein